MRHLRCDAQEFPVCRTAETSSFEIRRACGITLEMARPAHDCYWHQAAGEANGRFGSTAGHPLSCGKRQQRVVCRHSHRILALCRHTFDRPRVRGREGASCSATIRREGLRDSDRGTAKIGHAVDITTYRLTRHEWPSKCFTPFS